MLRSSLSIKTALKRLCAILLGGISLLLPLASQAQQPAFLSDGLVAYYPFNGNANDESGNGKNGQLNGTGTSYVNNRFGEINRSVHFDGSGYISVSPTPFNVKADFSVVLWSKVDAGNTGNNDLFSTGRDKGFYGFNLFAFPDGFRAGFWDNNDILAYQAPNAVFEWHQVAFTKLGNTISLSVDGLFVKKAIIVVTPNDSGVLWIGRHQYDNINYSAKGSVDDVRIYNRSLSDAEVKSLYDYESQSPNQSPLFVSQPVSKIVNTGDNVVFSVALQSGGTYNYQWQLNEQNIAEATTSSLSVNNAVAGVYRYRVIVSNAAGTVISDTATLTVVTPPAPSIATQPAAKTVQEGGNISFNVVASGQGSLVYQWQFNEQNLPGATSATLNLNRVRPRNFLSVKSVSISW